MNPLSQTQILVKYHMFLFQFILQFNGKLNRPRNSNYCFIWSNANT